MNEVMLIAALSNYYSQLERRLEHASNLRQPEVRQALAEAAFDLLVSSSPAGIRDELTGQREASIAAVLDQREAMSTAVHEVGRRLPRNVFTGPVNVAFWPDRRVNTVLVGQPGVVGEYMMVVRNGVHGAAPVLDQTATWADLDNRNSILYGTPEGNHLIGELLAESNWEVAKDFVRIGERKFEGESLVLIACRARPNDPTLCDVVYTGHDEAAIVGVNHLHHGPSDFVIGRQTKPNKYQILTRGNFGKGPRGEPLTTLT